MKLTTEEGMAIRNEQGEGRMDAPVDDGLSPFSQMPKIAEDCLQQARRKTKGNTEEWKETSEMIKEFMCIATMSRSRDVVVQAPPFLFGIMWVMKQLRDFFLTEKGG